MEQPMSDLERYQMESGPAIQERMAQLLADLPAQYQFHELSTPPQAPANPDYRIPTEGDWYKFRQWDQDAKASLLPAAKESAYAFSTAPGVRVETGEWRWLRDQLRRVASAAGEYAPGAAGVGTRRSPTQQMLYEEEMARLLGWQPSETMMPLGGKPAEIPTEAWLKLLADYRGEGDPRNQAYWLTKEGEWMPYSGGVKEPRLANPYRSFVDVQNAWETMQPLLGQLFMPTTAAGDTTFGSVVEPQPGGPPRRQAQWTTSGTNRASTYTPRYG